MGRAAAPCTSTTWLSRGTSAAVGPVMLNRDPPKMDAAAPAKTAVYRPALGGTPTATASAIERGSAMTPATRPAMALVRISGNAGRAAHRETGGTAGTETCTNHNLIGWFASVACEVS